MLAAGPEAVWKAFGPLHEKKREELEAIEDLEKGAIGDVNYEIESLRLDRKKLDLENPPAAEKRRREAEIDRELAEREAEYQDLADRLSKMREQLEAETLVMRTADGETKEMPVGTVVRAIRPNGMGRLDKLRLYAQRAWEFVSDDPRESNTEGGIFPAIFGTVMMVFLMSFAVAPLGVLAALYLREYAKQGLLVRMVRIAVNNLAGVPSIVFGVFGLGFFVYLIGGSIDRLFYPEALPTPTFGTGGILWASPDAGAAHRAGGDRGRRGGAGGGAAHRARGLARPRRHQVRDHPPRGGAGRGPRHPHRHDPGHGARRRRGGAADDRGHGEARAGPAGGRQSAVRPPRAQVHAPGLPHLSTSASRAPTWRPRRRWSSPPRCC